MCSVQSSLLFLYYVQCNVSSVLFMCQQDSVYTVFSVSLQRQLSSIAFNASSVQHQFSFLSIQSIGQNLQHTQSMVFGVSWVTVYGVHVAYYYSVSVVFSLVFSCHGVGFSLLQCSVSVQCLQRSGCVLFSGSFSVCTLQCLQCSRALAVHQESVMSMSCSKSTL